MNRRKILMIINFFPPAGGGGVYRPLSFVKYLSRLSWQVTVVTPRPGEFWISDPGLESEIPPDARIVRTASLSGFRLLRALRMGGMSGVSRRSSSGFAALRRVGEFFLLPDSYAGWVPFAVRAADELCRRERFDSIYSTSPPDSSHLVAQRIAAKHGLPWVADFRDPWINLHLRSAPTPLHRAIHERMERSVASRAALVLVTTLEQERMMRTRYPTSRVELIPNGYDEDDFARETGAPPPGGPMIVTHCGMLTLGRSAKPFLEALALLKERSLAESDGLRVAFVGPRETENEEWVRRFGLEGSVVFEDNLPHRECIRRERRSHVLLLLKHDDERYRGLIPGKLFEYIGARRPILAVGPEGEAAALVRELGRGETARIDRPGEIAAALHTMRTLHRAGKLESSYDLGEVARYSRRAEAERLSALLVRLEGERCAEKTSRT